MRKLRSDALWHKLTPEQQNQIQHWLFFEHLSYEQTHRLMQMRLGITCALSIIGPLYHHLKEVRSGEREAMLEKLTDVITEPGADLAGVRADSLAVITKRLIERSQARDSTKEIVALGRLMVRSEAREIDRDRVELARESLAFRQERTAFLRAHCLPKPNSGRSNPKSSEMIRNQPG
jgi:hypothetical protein